MCIYYVYARHALPLATDAALRCAAPRWYPRGSWSVLFAPPGYRMNMDEFAADKHTVICHVVVAIRQ